MNTTQNKIKSLSKKISTLMTIGLIVYSVVIIFAIGGLIAKAFNESGTFATFMQQFSVNGMNADKEIIYFTPLIIAIIIGSMFVMAELFILRRIFSVISCDATPFNKIHTKGIKIIASIEIISSIFNVTAYTLETIAVHNGWAFQINVSGIVFGVLLYLVALIYDYGCDLQKQSDETL